MRHKRNPARSVLVACLLGALVLPFKVFADAPAIQTNLSVGQYTLVESKRVSRVEFEYTYVAQVTNSGDAVEEVSATLSSESLAMTVIDASLSFGSVGAGQTVPSRDTFKVRHDRSMAPIDASSFLWRVSFQSNDELPIDSLELSLSNTVIGTASTGGGLMAVCVAVDADDAAVEPQPALQIAVSGDGVQRNGNLFSFEEAGKYDVSCTAGEHAISASEIVVVLDDSIDLAFSRFNADLATLEALLQDVVVADEAEDLAALQLARNLLLDTANGLDLEALESAPPLPEEDDVPTAEQLLAAGDTPNPAVDNVFTSTIRQIKQNLLDVQVHLDAVAPVNLSQADVDFVVQKTVELEQLLTELPRGEAISQTAILAVSPELNAIVSQLLPSQAAKLARIAADRVLLVPGITWLDMSPLPNGPTVILAVQRLNYQPGHGRGAAFMPVTLLPLPTLVTALRIRSQVFEQVYLPLISQIGRNVLFLSRSELGPFGLQPANIVEVAGPSLRNLLPGSTITVWGSEFAAKPENNVIRIETARGAFELPAIRVEVDGVVGEQRLDGGPIPSGLCICQFGIPELGSVRVVTPAGGSEAILVNVFP